MDSNVFWYDTGKEEPPDRQIVLVAGPLGIDLAMNIDGHWYFKTGDTWEPGNLEYWSCCTPTRWADFNYPKEPKDHSQMENTSGTDTIPYRKVLFEKDVAKEGTDFNFLMDLTI